MRSTLLRHTLLASLLTVPLVGLGTPTHAAAQDAATTPADTHDDDGFDKGLLGLLGLAGLLGLRRRDHHDVNRSTSSRV